MSAVETRAASVTAPFDRETANDFRVLKFTSGSTHAANAVPKAWEGKFVTMYASGEVHFAFSKSSSAEVDSTVTATASGASAKVGGVLSAVPRSMLVPESGPSERVYFVRESQSSQTVWMELSSP